VCAVSGDDILRTGRCHKKVDPLQVGRPTFHPPVICVIMMVYPSKTSSVHFHTFSLKTILCPIFQVEGSVNKCVDFREPGSVD